MDDRHMKTERRHGPTDRRAAEESRHPTDASGGIQGAGDEGAGYRGASRGNEEPQMGDHYTRGRGGAQGLEGESGWGSGPGASTYGGLAGGATRDERDEFDPEYRRWREQQMRDLDRDYDTWRQERYQKFSEEFRQWRAVRNADANPSNASSTSAPFPKRG